MKRKQDSRLRRLKKKTQRGKEKGLEGRIFWQSIPFINSLSGNEDEIGWGKEVMWGSVGGRGGNGVKIGWGRMVMGRREVARWDEGEGRSRVGT